MDSLLINTEPVTITALSIDLTTIFDAKMGVFTVVRKDNDYKVYNLEGEEIGLWFGKESEPESIWTVVSINLIRNFQIIRLFNAYT